MLKVLLCILSLLGMCWVVLGLMLLSFMWKCKGDNYKSINKRTRCTNQYKFNKEIIKSLRN